MNNFFSVKNKFLQFLKVSAIYWQITPCSSAFIIQCQIEIIKNSNENLGTQMSSGHSIDNHFWVSLSSYFWELNWVTIELSSSDYFSLGRFGFFFSFKFVPILRSINLKKVNHHWRFAFGEFHAQSQTWEKKLFGIPDFFVAFGFDGPPRWAQSNFCYFSNIIGDALLWKIISQDLFGRFWREKACWKTSIFCFYVNM